MKWWVKVGWFLFKDYQLMVTGSAIRTSLLVRINPKNQQRRYIIYHLWFLGLIEVIMANPGLPSLNLTYPLKMGAPWRFGDSELGKHHF